MKAPAILCAMALLSGVAAIASAADRDLSCKMTFSTKAWSALYSSAQGEGTVTCADGSSMPVTISAKGIGLSAGKWKITEGRGTFTHVERADDVLGTYAALSGDVGLKKAGTAQLLSKGKVSLALAGQGEGFDVGVALSRVEITKSTSSAK